MLEQIEREELVRLRKIERVAKALLGYRPVEEVAYHVELCLADPGDPARVVALAYKLEEAEHGHGQRKVLSMLYSLKEAVFDA